MSSRSPTKRRRTVIARAAIIASVAACALLAFVIVLFMRGPASSPKVSATFVPAAPEPAATRAPVNAYMIGDSVVSGASIGEPSRLLGAQAAKRMNWIFTRDGFGGSGYVAQGNQPTNGLAADKSFRARLPDIVQASPDVVIVAGGRNDMPFPTEQVAAEAELFFTELRDALPATKIVTIGGWRWHTEPELKWVDKQAAISSSLRSATEAVGGIYIDPVGDLAPIDDSMADTMITDDNFHPAVEGHAYIGRDLAYELVERGLPRGPEDWVVKGIQTGEYEDASDRYFAEPR